VAAPTGRVEDSQFPRVFLRAKGDVNRLIQKFFLREVVLRNWGCWRLLPLVKKDLVRSAYHITALVAEFRISPSHLVPHAAQRVVGQELDDVAGREELVAKGKFVGVAWRLASTSLNVSRSISHFLWCEILIHPADGLIKFPDARQFGIVQQFKQLIQCLLPRVEPVGGIIGIE